MTKFAIPKAMNTEIWSSSQMGGTGGALKALAKNLANQLNLNRTEMKRVVARVISERHGQGDVGDYNGHMFYVKPERIDLTEQITLSKEAFDDMLNHKQLKAYPGRPQMPISRSDTRSRSFTSNMTMRLNKPDKSLPGVITDQHHLLRPRTPQDIRLQAPKSRIRPMKSKQFIKRKPQTAQNTQSYRQTKRSKSFCINAKPISKMIIQTKPKLSKSNGKPDVKNLKRKPLLSNRSTGSNMQQKPKPKTQSEIESQPQDQSEEQTVILMPTTSKKKPVLGRKKSLKQLPNARSKVTIRKSFEQPWQEAKKRLRAGGIVNKANKNRTSLAWRNTYQFSGGAGTPHRTNVNQYPKTKVMAVSKPKGNNTTNRNLNHANVERIRHKRCQARLAKELEREEAIDDPERLEAGSILSYSFKRSQSAHSGRGRRPYKLSARLEELAKPVFHGKLSTPEKLSTRFSSPSRSRSHSPIRKPKLKLRLRRRRRRVVVNSSLGSIAGLKGTSLSGLTPAKRHLTLAFMNKDSPRSPRRSRSIMWR